MTYLTFIGLCLGIYALSYQIMIGLARAHARSYLLLRLILLPGVILHELAHLIACYLTFTPVVAVSFWDEQGGHVIHHKPKWPFLIQPIISFAPFPVGIISLLVLSRYVQWDAVILSVIALFLMVSIAGTLAPSKADFIPALEGLFVITAITGAGYYYFPNVFLTLEPFIASFNQPLLSVGMILLIIWGIIVALVQTRRHIYRA